MSNRSVRDGIILVGGFHFFMAVLCLVGVAAAFVFAVLPPIQQNVVGLAQKLFLPVLAMILGLIIAGIYAFIGFGLIRLQNSARMMAIFMGALGVFGGFIGVMSSIAANIIGQGQPDWLSIILVGFATVCLYTFISFMNIFILIFLYNPRLRVVFYGEDWVANGKEAGNNDASGNSIGAKKIAAGEEDLKQVSSLADLKD
jgi:hypothetical protein